MSECSYLCSLHSMFREVIGDKPMIGLRTLAASNNKSIETISPGRPNKIANFQPTPYISSHDSNARNHDSLMDYQIICS